MKTYHKENIKAIILDCFGVVFHDKYKDFLRSHQKSLKNYIEVNKSPLELEQYLDKWHYPEYYNYLSHQVDLKRITDQKYYQIFSEASGVQAIEIQKEFNDVNCINDEVIECIFKLKNAGYKIGLIANTDRKFLDKFLHSLVEKLNLVKIEELFDTIKTSSQVKSEEKRSKEMVDTIISDLSVLQEEMLIVEDSANGVAQFQQLGIKAVEFVGTLNELIPDLLTN